ncbi:MAG: NAD-dependent epimerase/dehydratase family protein [Candidatus Eisenbacteria bacterium]
MRIAITGGAGYVGAALRRAVRERGDAWIGLTRRAPDSAEAGGEWVTGELADAAALDRLVRDADALVHAAAWVHREAADPASRDACFAVNLRGTERLLEAVRRRGVRLRFVFVSSTAVYGDEFEDRPEAGPFEPVGAYGESKLAAERAVLTFAAAGAAPAVVIRPAMVYGPGAPGNIMRMASFVRRGFAPLVNGGRNRKSIVHADDLALALLRAIDRATECSGAIFNAAGDPAPTMREVGDALASGLKRRTRWVPVPDAIWNAGIALGHWRSRSTGGRAPDFGRTMEIYASSTTVTCSAIRDRLGASFRDAREGLASSVHVGNAR